MVSIALARPAFTSLAQFLTFCVPPPTDHKFWKQPNLESLVAKTMDLSEKHVGILAGMHQATCVRHEVKDMIETL